MNIRARVGCAGLWLLAILIGPLAAIGFVGAFVWSGLRVGHHLFHSSVEVAEKWANEAWSQKDADR